MFYRITRYGTTLRGKAVNTGAVVMLPADEGAALVGAGAAIHLDDAEDKLAALASIERDLIAIEPVGSVYLLQDFKTVRDVCFVTERHPFPESICADLVARGWAVYDTPKPAPNVVSHGTAGAVAEEIGDATLRKAVGDFQKVAHNLIASRDALNGEVRRLTAALTALQRTPVTKADFLDMVRADLNRVSAHYQGAMRAAIAVKVGAGQTSLAAADGVLRRGNILGLPYDSGPDDGFSFPCGELIAAGIGRLIEDVSWPDNARPLAELRAEAAALEDKIARASTERDAITRQLQAAGVIAAVD